MPLALRPWVVLSFALALLSSSSALAQKHIRPSAPASNLPDTHQSIALDAQSDVPASVAVDAVLLPYTLARRTFGREIADHYAVVQLTIANHNPRAAFLLQSAVLDDCHWLLSGRITLDGSTNCPRQPDGAGPYRQGNLTTQVASVEARIVRGELQDQQPFTARNWIVRSAVAAGSIAAGFQFLTMDTDIIKGISSYGNQLIPALGLLWPDNTQARINRISDFGFQTNKVIAKSSSAPRVRVR